ncbi:uncharacterized protein LOC111051300 isoform X1 [Nilaparvata lugens]|uniref:uncharacterized protein LOC111051300 isoform X1 n=1 Tax=Nilaparvata lugens TaxID=108931 RepID=UPI000B983E69|nr:uncharacterized protein LOC111051300 isoform X1 [Nilaparvata lugens]XP_039288126.1 uncharacterized protein LOC111051300 isoform X1 [Nilaparvata lugens]
MNILIRKNFHSDGGGGSKDRFGKGAGRRGGGKGVHGKRTRDPMGGGGGGYSSMEDSGYHTVRTHIFFSPSNLGLQDSDGESDPERYGGGGGVLGGLGAAAKRPSVTLMKWAVGGGKRKPSGGRTTEYPAAPPASNGGQLTPSRQVSFNNGQSRTGGGGGGAMGGSTTPSISLQQVPRAEPLTLATLDRDCFIIPVASVDRFLPAGVPLPLAEAKPSVLSVLEVDDPKLCVLIHLMTQMEPIEPILESPLAMPLVKQKSAACDLLSEVGSAKSATEGMLLANLEKNAEFPFISYYVINKSQTDPRSFFDECRAASLKKFDPRSFKYTAAHTFDLFQEVATIARPPLDTQSKRPHTKATGFIISVYKVFEGDDGEKFEKNWLYWTGARMIYRYLPKSVGLRRITLHKSLGSGDKLYLLLVECSNFMQDLTAAAVLIPALRARLCGYTGLYRTTAVF